MQLTHFCKSLLFRYLFRTGSPTIDDVVCGRSMSVCMSVSLCNYPGVKREETAPSLITALLHCTQINIVAMHYTVYTQTPVFGFSYEPAVVLFGFVNVGSSNSLNTSR